MLVKMNLGRVGPWGRLGGVIAALILAWGIGSLVGVGAAQASGVIRVGQLVQVGSIYEGAVLAEADGTQRRTRGRVVYDAGGWQVYEGVATDGSGIAVGLRTRSGRLVSGWARHADGTVVEYGAVAEGGRVTFPVRVSAAQGETVTIRYRGDVGPTVEAFLDGWGRVIEVGGAQAAWLARLGVAREGGASTGDDGARLRTTAPPAWRDEGPVNEIPIPSCDE